jgi:hypothetical protein
VSPLKYFILCLFAGTAVSLIIPALPFLPDYLKPTFYIEIALLHTVWNATLYLLFFRSVEKETFISRYMTTLVLKFTTALVFMVAFGLADHEGVVPNTLFIAFNYVVFLVLEITVLYRRLNPAK